MNARELNEIQKLMSIFMPYAAQRLADMRSNNKRFVHYSFAENILRIIQSKTVWLRNTRCMADYSEVEIGYWMLRQFFRD
jgi:hypothetical protein